MHFIPSVRAFAGLYLLVGSGLASDFQSFLNQQGVPELLRDRQPTHLMSPLACIAAQMNALQRNDWPETDAGVQTAFAFAKWEGADELLSAQVGPQRVRSWAAREEWLALPDFSNQLHSPPYSALLNCHSWQPASQLVFPSNRHRNKAVCAVAATAAGRQHVFTFCLERVLQGPLRNCWLTVGVRDGDYANC
ncbi:hypothetical protein ABPG75_003193 [Micractinium tetrahymenae]